MQTFVTKLGIVVHHDEPECHVKKLGFYLQGQGHSVGLYNQNMTVSTTLLSPTSTNPPPFSPSLISRTVSVDVKHHGYFLLYLLLVLNQ